MVTPNTPIVILSGYEDDKLVFSALEAGADGYLSKRTKPADLRAALLDVLAGGAPMTSGIARRVVRSFRQKTQAPDDETVRLTSREEEVLILLSKGYANKEIADRMSLSVDTVRSYLKRIYKKMHIRSRTQAVLQYAKSSLR